MNFNELNPPISELPINQSWYRIQRTNGRAGTIRLNGHTLPPRGLLTGRFDLHDESTSYLADSEGTALYEALFRREVHSCPWERLQERSLIKFRTIPRRLRVAVLQGLEEQHPVLQSMRYEETQAFARECRARALDGILYASAQHASHGCLCLFEPALAKLKRVEAVSLVAVGSTRLHRAVVRAAKGSRIPITPPAPGGE